MKIADLPLPSTQASSLALQVAQRFHSPGLVNHCRRSYLWAAALGVQRGLDFDAELLYVSAMLHDIGLTAAFDNHTVDFETAGGYVGWVFAAGAGWPAERRDRVGEIIVRHMWQSVDPAFDAEGFLLESATSLDITGHQPQLWPTEFCAEVIASIPRLDLAVEFARCFTEQAERKPDCNAARSVRNGIVERLAA
ncbi:MAG: HD domain-containing protein, partial [Jatrophihabitantaceae bacterium]